MTRSFRLNRSSSHADLSGRAKASWLSAILVGIVLALPAAAQVAREPVQPPTPRSGQAPKAEPTPPVGTPDALPDVAPAPGQPGASGQQRKPVLPQARSDGARALEKLPQTAEEKSRALNDLYAQLATAESEEAAKKIAGQIERLWRHSGSDTANLLVSRALKAAGEKRLELAEKLFEHAVKLAPDYTEAFTQRAFYHFTQNNMLAAVGDLRRVLALDPNHFKALEGLAQIWSTSGNKKGAFEVMRQLLDVHPFANGAKQTFEELKREVEGQGI